MEEPKVLKSIPVPKAEYAIQVSLNGKIIEERPLQPSHSWVRNIWINWFFNLGYKGITGDTTYGEGYYSGWDIDNTTDTVQYSQLADATLGEATELVVGTGTDAESILGYKLATIIAHGTSTGQLYYQASENMVQSWVGGVVSCSRSRFYNNNSGGSITVNEVGIYSNFPAGSQWMLCRDKLSTGVVVPDTGQLKLTYIMTGDVSP